MTLQEMSKDIFSESEESLLAGTSLDILLSTNIQFSWRYGKSVNIDSNLFKFNLS